MIQGLSISPGGKFEKFGILHSGKDLRGDLITVYKYIKCGSQVDGARLFSVMCSSRTRGNGNQQEHGEFCTNTREVFNLSV